ncbi:MAG: hypothetical protein LBK59_06320, partial [Bifidobacteriaceae bacterium]|nr:hypothetical protein [Bifidobacteriaceae bacterium]
MRDLPTVRAVRGSVATSAQVKAAPGSGVLAIPVAPGVDGEEIQPRPTTVDAALRYGIDIAEYAERRGFTAAAGTTLSIDLPLVHGAVATQLPWHGLASTVVLVGIGGGTRGELRRAGKAIAKAATGRGSVVTTVASGGTAGSRSTDPNAAEDARALVEGYLDGCYTIPTIAYGDSETRRATTRERRVNALAARVAGRAGRHRRDASVAGERHGELVLLGKYDPAAIAAATGTARATWLARDLANAPANIKNPAWLAEQFATIGAAGGLDVEVWDAERLERQGFGALAAVGAGGEHGPRLAVIRYTPAGPATGHVAVVGKGVTFDSGGLDIKP